MEGLLSRLKILQTTTYQRNRSLGSTSPRYVAKMNGISSDVEACQMCKYIYLATRFFDCCGFCLHWLHCNLRLCTWFAISTVCRRVNSKP